MYLIVPEDKVLDHWNKNAWSSTPKKEINAARFVLEMDIVISRSLVKKIKEHKTKVELTPRSKRYLGSLSTVA